MGRGVNKATDLGMQKGDIHLEDVLLENGFVAHGELLVYGRGEGLWEAGESRLATSKFQSRLLCYPKLLSFVLVI